MAIEKVNLTLLIDNCRRGQRVSQQKLYEHFFGYGLSICLRYANDRSEALEILNDGFLKVFTKLDQYDAHFPFKGWLRQILIHTAIDSYRTHQKYRQREAPTEDLTTMVSVDEIPMPRLSPDEDVLPIIQQLSPAYRMVFNLFVMEGYKHHEIAEKLGIKTSTSKANLYRAKTILRKWILSKKYNISKSS